MILQLHNGYNQRVPFDTKDLTGDFMKHRKHTEPPNVRDEQPPTMSPSDESITEYFNAVANRDWFHEMSDSYSVYLAGTAELKRLQHLAEGSEILQRILDDWTGHYYSGEPWSTPKAPRPVLENYLAKSGAAPSQAPSDMESSGTTTETKFL